MVSFSAQSCSYSHLDLVGEGWHSERHLNRMFSVISMKLGKKMGFLNLGHFGRCVQRFASSFPAASKGAAASVSCYHADLSDFEPKSNNEPTPFQCGKTKTLIVSKSPLLEAF